MGNLRVVLRFLYPFVPMNENSQDSAIPGQRTKLRGVQAGVQCFTYRRPERLDLLKYAHRLSFFISRLYRHSCGSLLSKSHHVTSRQRVNLLIGKLAWYDQNWYREMAGSLPGKP